jgi:hypothetical protein
MRMRDADTRIQYYTTRPSPVIAYRGIAVVGIVYPALRASKTKRSAPCLRKSTTSRQESHQRFWQAGAFPRGTWPNSKLPQLDNEKIEFASRSQAWQRADLEV